VSADPDGMFLLIFHFLSHSLPSRSHPSSCYWTSFWE
jgi:hypothetical protein